MPPPPSSAPPVSRPIAAWTSADGTSWAPAAISGAAGARAGGSYKISALASSGTTVTAIGSIATQSSQEVFTVSRQVP